MSHQNDNHSQVGKLIHCLELHVCEWIDIRQIGMHVGRMHKYLCTDYSFICPFVSPFYRPTLNKGINVKHL